MMTDHDLSRNLTGVSRDAKLRMADAEKSGTSPPAQPRRFDGAMWPMYLCFGMLILVLAFTILPRWL